MKLRVYVDIISEITANELFSLNSRRYVLFIRYGIKESYLS